MFLEFLEVLSAESVTTDYLLEISSLLALDDLDLF